MSLPAFLDSWSRFAEPNLLTILAAMALSILGVVTAARRQVFMAAAVAQAAQGEEEAAMLPRGLAPDVLVARPTVGRQQPAPRTDQGPAFDPCKSSLIGIQDFRPDMRRQPPGDAATHSKKK